MKIKLNLLAVGLVLLATGGCISSTTTTSQASSNPSNEEAASRNFELGVRYYRNGSYELARERLQRALDFDPHMAMAHMTLGLTYQKLENKRLATEHYELAVKYEPNNFTVRNAYAVFLCGQREFDEAEKQFERAVDHRENDNPELMLTNAGVCMAQKPDYEASESFFRRAIEARPNYGEALFQMAMLQHRVDEDLAARAFVQRFLATNKSNAEILMLAVQVEESLGDTRASTNYANQLLREFPQSPQARQILASGLYSRSGD